MRRRFGKGPINSTVAHVMRSSMMPVMHISTTDITICTAVTSIWSSHGNGYARYRPRVDSVTISIGFISDTNRRFDCSGHKPSAVRAAS